MTRAKTKRKPRQKTLFKPDPYRHLPKCLGHTKMGLCSSVDDVHDVDIEMQWATKTPYRTRLCVKCRMGTTVLHDRGAVEIKSGG